MAGSINSATLIGNVGRDPEIRTTQAGDKMATFSMATSETWTKDGERQERTTWHRIVVLNERIADVVERFVKKGTKLYCQGAIQHRKYTDNAGTERDVSEIVLGRFRGELVLLDSRPAGESTQTAPKPQQQRMPIREGAGSKIEDDEIPW